MKNIDITELGFMIFLIIAGAALIMVAIAAYLDIQSRINWRESTSLEMIEMVKRETINEYISKPADYETTYE